MLTLTVIFAIYMGLAFWVWRSTPPLVTPFHLQNEEFCYCYTTTQFRRATVFLGSCTLFASGLTLITFSVGYALWEELLHYWMHEVFLYLLYGGLVILAVQIVRLPKVMQFLLEACGFFQRYQFFPTLPSKAESDLIEKLAQAPLENIPEEIRVLLDQDAEPVLVGDTDLAREACAQYCKLEVIYTELSLLAKTKRTVVRRFYFGQDWDIIVSLYREIDRKMHSNNSDMDANLAHKIQLCLYYCYGLLTRVIVETSLNAEDSKAWFKRFGFEV